MSVTAPSSALRNVVDRSVAMADALSASRSSALSVSEKTFAAP